MRVGPLIEIERDDIQRQADLRKLVFHEMKERKVPSLLDKLDRKKRGREKPVPELI